MSAHETDDRALPLSDGARSATGAAVFSVGLGVVSVAVPLLGLRSGYSTAELGVLIALSAVSQMTARVFMGRMMRRLPDKVFVVAAGALLAASSFILLLSTGWVAFALSQLLLGVARAYFWTGTQTHAVRMSTSAVGAMARINLAAGVGQLAGPVLAGLLAERSLQWALGVAGISGVLTMVPAALLVQLPPFAAPSADRPPGRIWRRPGVEAACWAGASAGAWRGLLNSYVPVALEQARQSSFVIGVLVSAANAASVVGGAATGKVRGRGRGRSLFFGVLAAGAGTAAVGVLADSAAACAVTLVLSGLGAGALQTVGPAVATESVHPEERGEAIASSGMWRASAMFLAPLGIAGLVTVAPLSLALAVGGTLIAVPAVTIRRLGHPPARR